MHTQKLKGYFLTGALRVMHTSIIIIIHSFYIALFSALEQTHCAHVACDSEQVTLSFL